MQDNNDDEVVSPPSEENWSHEETGTASNLARFPSEEVDDGSMPPPLPRRQEQTLKEKLVERERQARVETERARLKRQFALSSNGGAMSSGDLHRENGSVEGTVGEGSSVAAPNTEEVHDDDGENGEDDRKQLGYVMERFLRGDGAAEEEEQVEKPTPEPGVLMERFLAEPVVVEQDAAAMSTEDHLEEGHVEEEAKRRAQDEQHPQVTFEHGTTDGINPLPPSVTSNGPTISRDDSELEATAGSIRSYSTVTNASLAQVGTIDVDALVEEPPEDEEVEREELSADHSSLDEPRVLRLTEAEIQEMAAIEEASIGNAPPSERDDTFSASSLVGDLVGDLGIGRDLDPVGDFSAGTTTTALESASITSAGGDDLTDRSPAIEIETESVDAIETASVNSHLVVSPGASSEGSVSITAHPPSVTAEEPSLLSPDGSHAIALPHNDIEGSAVLEMLSFEQQPNASLECAPSFEDGGGALDVAAAAKANVGVLNRQSLRSRARLHRDAPQTPGSEISMEERQKRVQITLEGFDYDRNAQDSLMDTPHSRAMDSYNELPGNDPWSPPGEMNMSPLGAGRAFAAARVAGAPPEYPSLEGDSGTLRSSGNYGSIDARGQQRVSPPSKIRLTLPKSVDDEDTNEKVPLVGSRDIEGQTSHDGHEEHPPKHQDLKHAVSNIFSSLRSDSTTTIEEVNTDSEQYLAFNILKRGRLFDDAIDPYCFLCSFLHFATPHLW